ncbi:exodeoxyribonuclease V subunit alpha [Svornostia abyssi]|uniref:RecBCD enzyme subunit RecD n=1 Tax=Svornostia abyssi TaxID=2898438 RepID=A0ABY5PGS1_9ACTN|nr:exodeoxyribonuclease V subunit alpha [Parviterribacteraceae bacterium J379]
MTEDLFDWQRAVGVSDGLLAEFNAAGVLGTSDVHAALRFGALVGEESESVLLAAALAVRAPRFGHVFADLSSVVSTITVEPESGVDVAGLPWPAADAWIAAVGASPLVAEEGPLRLVDSALYLERYWVQEGELAADLRARNAAVPSIDEAALADGLARLFTDPVQARAGEVAVRRQLSVVAGGPGTGKTTTVARIAALLFEQGAGLIALAAPTGKAAARLEEAVHEEAAGLDASAEARAAVGGLRAQTLHRLLGWRPDSRSRFRHGRGNRLPHDVVIVDETSMVSLSMMASLVAAVRPGSRLVLVGDPGQLTSVEAGAVLGDIVASSVLADGVVVLERVHRFAGGIAELATAVAAGDDDAVLDLLLAGLEDVVWVEVDAAGAAADELDEVRAIAVASAADVVTSAREGDAGGALAALESFRLLCAHRRGPHGAMTWMWELERWLAEGVPGFDPGAEWYVGRPLLVTENDYGLKLYNGDTGVVIAVGDDRVEAAFERGGEPVRFAPTRLGAVDTVYAMTIHKSQGSQFGTVAVVLPDAGSAMLTRELLYTAVTRARERVVLVGDEAAVRAAVGRSAGRASGLAQRL